MRSLLVPAFLCLLLSATATFTFNSRYLDTPSDNPCLPTQVHINLGDAYYNSMGTDLNSNDGLSDNTNATAFIVWQTKDVCNDTYISITSDSLSSPLNITGGDIWLDMINATVDVADNGGGPAGQYLSYSHTALLYVKPGYNYTYSIYEVNGTNQTGPFKALLPILDNSKKSVRFAVYGDIDTRETNDTINWLNEHAQQNSSFLDMHLCLGDLAYDIFTENGTRGEEFFATAQPAITTWPFMISPGNHERYLNYTFLNFRAKMPLYNVSNNHFYSFNLGKIHFINVDTFFLTFYPDNFQIMYDWVKNDLELAVQNRANRPWIIVYCHRPIYCSYNSPTDPEYKKCYSSYTGQEMWDQLYHDYQVDFVLQAHVHYWERMGPVYKNASAPYAYWSEDLKNHSLINPTAPIYTIEGAAGNAYFMVQNATPLASYSIKANTTIGVTVIETINDTALHYQHINSVDGTTSDEFYLLKGDEYPSPPEPTPDDPTGTPSPSRGWLIALILIALAALIGLLVYRRYRHKQADDLQDSMIAEKDAEVPRYIH